MSNVARLFGAANDFTHVQGLSGLTAYYVANMVCNGSLGTGAPTANVLRAMPFNAPRRGGTIDRLAFEITVNVAGNTRIGLYRNTSETNLYPSTLMVDSGSIVNAAAFQSFTTSQAMTPGALYWLAIVGDVAPTIRAIALTNCGAVLGNGGSGGLPNLGLSVAHVYAALPNPFTAGAAYITTNPIPALFCRFSA